MWQVRELFFSSACSSSVGDVIGVGVLADKYVNRVVQQVDSSASTGLPLQLFFAEFVCLILFRYLLCTLYNIHVCGDVYVL